MSETQLNDGLDASHIKSESPEDAVDGVRQRLKFDGEASGMTPDPKRSKETVKQGEIFESNALPDELPEKKRVRFLTDSGDGGACAITVEELVEDYWCAEQGQGEMFEGLHCKVEPDLDVTNTEAVSDRLLENGVVRDICTFLDLTTQTYAPDDLGKKQSLVGNHEAHEIQAVATTT